MARLCGALALAAWAALAPAQPADGALAARLVERSGLARQLEEYPRQVREQMEQARGQVPEALFAATRDAAMASYDPGALAAEIAGTLTKTLSRADIEQALVWLESGVGQRVTRAEEAAAASSSPAVLQAYAAELERRPLPAERTRLIAGLIDATRAVEQGARAAESVSLAVALGIDAAQPEQSRLGLGRLREAMRLMMPAAELRARISALLPPTFAYTYRELDDADLAAYLEFSRSPLGQRYHDALVRAFTEALTRASYSMGPLIEQALRGKAI